MTKPFYIVQTFDPKDVATEESRRKWLEDHIAKARAEGGVFSRVTINEEALGLLFEAWSERPVDQGAPRWSLAFERGDALMQRMIRESCAKGDKE